ncbi:MAG: HlyD family efflux transporter periplasmic adaptor subunit [Gammaproteobacteria bacterium]|nr:HlyD family efflux transporter periplasmic adaptor subunit [Gammaproteobacteria bacterium]NNM00041.1 HlyD family efflux transporter periplasmic adaptor subunit [Gammaproteobacteria bacterium]
MLWTVPWVQTAAGTGQVVALDPRDRVQTINALVQGRVNRSFVQDGSVVKEGDPIVEIADVDPNFVQRLQAEREALAGRLEAARVATVTAKIDYDRQKRLFAEGLSARKDFESAKIRYQEMLAVEAQARAGLSKADIGVSRQSSQVVRAPQDGRILRINAGNTATIIKAGDPIATFAPEHVTRAVEVFVNGLDAPLVQEGLDTRIMFEGWPAVQFSGWPESALGTFAGTVSTVDPVASDNGLFRVLVVETADQPWPEDRYLRLGSQARAWVQLSTVKLGYEIWRKLNRFPPRPVDAEKRASGIMMH